jgi:SAM-dependent methyltransferase
MNLYKSLAWVYHEMYHGLFDYDAEFEFYKSKLKEYKAESVIELGCGTGNLAKRFTNANFDYCGVDLNKEMLEIAQKEMPNAIFFQADICSLKTDRLFDAAIISGRTISYLTENSQIESCFESILNSLKPNGILIFDAIDSTKLFNDFDVETKILEVNGFKRISKSKPVLLTGMTWDWESDYYQLKGNEYKWIGKDKALLRAFGKEELEMFLNKAGFNLISTFKKDTYTWEDDYFLAQKR